MDPQHRLLLETSYHAIEDAGIDPSSLRKQRWGVFVGLSTLDYARRMASSSDDYNGFLSRGARAACRGADRYHLGLEGPAFVVDTACSSSLVAVHQALGALAAGECDAAIVAGASLMLTHDYSVDLAQAGMLAADGRCKTFTRHADGFARGEGIGAVVLMRQSDAVRTGKRIYANLLGSAVNSDGRSNGITAPSQAAQRRVIEDALSSRANAGRRLLCRNTRDRHRPRRSNRAVGARRRVRQAHASAVSRGGQGQYRPLRGKRRDREPDQGGSVRVRETTRAALHGRRYQRGSAACPLPGRDPCDCHVLAAGRSGRAADRGCQLVRHERHQRARRAGRVARPSCGHAGGAAAARACCSCRPARRRRFRRWLTPMRMRSRHRPISTCTRCATRRWRPARCGRMRRSRSRPAAGRTRRTVARALRRTGPDDAAAARRDGLHRAGQPVRRHVSQPVRRQPAIPRVTHGIRGSRRQHRRLEHAVAAAHAGHRAGCGRDAAARARQRTSQLSLLVLQCALARFWQELGCRPTPCSGTVSVNMRRRGSPAHSTSHGGHAWCWRAPMPWSGRVRSAPKDAVDRCRGGSSRH